MTSTKSAAKTASRLSLVEVTLPRKPRLLHRSTSITVGNRRYIVQWSGETCDVDLCSEMFRGLMRKNNNDNNPAPLELDSIRSQTFLVGVVAYTRARPTQICNSNKGSTTIYMPPPFPFPLIFNLAYISRHVPQLQSGSDSQYQCAYKV